MMDVVTIIGVVAAYALVFMAAICLLAEKGIHPFRRLRRKFAKLPFFAKLLVNNIIPNWKTKGRYPQVEYLVPMATYLGYSVEFLLCGAEIRSESIGDRLYRALLEQAPAVLQGLIETYIEKKAISSAPAMA